MLKAYKASISFLAERVEAVGAQHRSNENIKNSELLHLNSLFRAEEVPPGAEGRTSMTELIQHIRTDSSNIFLKTSERTLWKLQLQGWVATLQTI